jgi:hypothetical protein
MDRGLTLQSIASELGVSMQLISAVALLVDGIGSGRSCPIGARTVELHRTLSPALPGWYGYMVVRSGALAASVPASIRWPPCAPVTRS